MSRSSRTTRVLPARPFFPGYARALATGAEMRVEKNWITNNYPHLAFVSFGPSPVLPDESATVIKVELAE